VTALLPDEPSRLRRLRQVSVALFAGLDQTRAVGTALDGAQELLGGDGASFWAREEQALTCQLAHGADSEALLGTTWPAAAFFTPDAAGLVLVTPLVIEGAEVGALRVTRGADERALPFSAADAILLQDLADSLSAALAAAIAAETMAGPAPQQDLALVLQMSQEIGSSLDLDRVCKTVVNLAARAVAFDRGAVALYDNGRCEVRAVAGSDVHDAASPAMQDLAVRAGWAAGVGTRFYLSDRHAPRTDAERIFLQIFSQDLETAGVESGLYLPLRDDEGVVGILVFEAERADFVTEAQQELVTILANQTTVAIRNAQLYARVPMADALSTLTVKRQQFLAIPRRKRRLAGGIALVVLALLLLVRWPLRVPAVAPTFRPVRQADVRAALPGVVEEVFVREGSMVAAGAPIARLRDLEARATRAALAADIAAAERAASLAASRQDAASERLQRLRAAALREELAIETARAEQLVLRAPIAGVVLTPRPEERVGAGLAPGETIVSLGQLDSLDLDFGVAQHEVDRVTVGATVRLRVDALPSQTFTGIVQRVGAMAVMHGTDPLFPIMARIANPEGHLRPGMAPHARVLTAPTSVLGRAVRTPWRRLQLFWWRIWSWA
jgi:multidrug resistance efflux pump